MPEPLLVRLLGALLPDPIREDVFRPSIADVRIAALERKARCGSTFRSRANLRDALDVTLVFLACCRLVPGALRERRLARRQFDSHRKETLPVMLYTLRHAMRLLVRERGFTATAVLTLALGLGFNLAIFAVIEAVMLRPLPYPDAEHLVILNHRDTRTGITKEFIAIGDFVDMRARQSAFEVLTSYGQGPATITAEGDPFRVPALQAGPGLLETLDVRPLLGRTLRPDDSKPGAPAVALISEQLWESRFGSQPSVIGRSIRLGTSTRQVVGIYPRGFSFPAGAATDLIIPATLPPAAPANRKGGWAFAVARLKPGVSVEAANADLASLSKAFEVEFPDSNAGSRYYAVPLRDQLLGETKRPLLLLVAAVAVVLLIACVNVGNLLLARGLGRRHEMSVRAALGAGRARLVLQLLAESLVLCLTAGIAALIVAHWGVPALLTLVPPQLQVPGLSDVGLNRQVVLYALGICVATSVAFAVLSGVTIRGQQGSGALTSQTRVAGSLSTRRLTSSLIVVEVALSVVLLIGAGLILRSFAALLAVDPGFRLEGVAVIDLTLPADRYQAPATRQAFFDRAFASIRALPEVQAAGAATVTPLTGNNWTVPFDRADRPVPAGTRPPDVGWQVASGGYFKALGIPLLSGRLFESRDGGASAPDVVIISQAIAHLYFPGESAVGKRIRSGDGTAEIVGVVGDIRRASLTDEPRADMYFPFEKVPSTGTTLFVRTTGDPATMFATLREQLKAAEPSIVLPQMRTLDGVARTSIASTRLVLWLLGLFAAVALVLAAIGVYGVMSYIVSQRTREFGTRVALGASRRDILLLVLRQGSTMTVSGLAIGIGAGLILARLLGSSLYGVSPADPVTIAGAVLGLGLATLGASYIPARRATRLDAARTLAGQ